MGLRNFDFAKNFCRFIVKVLPPKEFSIKKGSSPPVGLEPTTFELEVQHASPFTFEEAMEIQGASFTT